MNMLDMNGNPIKEEVVWKAEKQEMSMWTKLKNRQGTIYMPEILKAISQEEILEDRVKMFRLWVQRDGKNFELFQLVMQYLYHPKIKFDLPDTRPPFTLNGAVDFGKAPNTLYKAIRRCKYFIECPTKITQKAKRENIFIRELESMYKDEAELFLMLAHQKIDKRVYPNVDEDLFRAVSPNLLPPKVVVEKPQEVKNEPVEVKTEPKKAGRPKTKKD